MQKCTKADYTECAARRVLSKYDVVPVDPEAKEKCQYSYASSELVVPDPATPGLIEKPEFANLGTELEALQLRVPEYDRLKMAINDILHPNGDGPANPSMCDLVAYIRNDWNRFTKEIQDLCQQAEEMQIKLQGTNRQEVDADLNDEDGLPVTLALNNGLKIVMPLPAYMTECLMEEIQRPNRFSRSICAKFVDGEFVAIDMQEVAAMHVSGLPDAEWVEIKQAPVICETSSEPERYRVECKCGAEYFCTMNASRPKARCRDCQSTAFADRNVDKLNDPSDGSEATLLTNRYFVSREPYQAREQNQERATSGRDLRNINQNHGREYKDPCRLIG